MVHLPWLQHFDRPLLSVGMDPVYGVQKAPAGSIIHLDEANQRARITYPNGRIRAWEGLKHINVRPGESWEVTWMRQEEEEPRIYFSVVDDDCEDEDLRKIGYNFASREIEGQEAALFPEYVRLMRDPVLNPSGFPLKSGVYMQFFVRFNINFGENGSTPSIATIEETAPPILDFPYRTEIAVLQPFELSGHNVPEGTYKTEILGYDTDTGEAIIIECRGFTREGITSFHTDSEGLARLMHEGKVNLLRVIEDKMPNF